MGFPDGSGDKNPPAKAGDKSPTLQLGRSPGEGNSNPPQYSFRGKSHGQRSLADYSPWSLKGVREYLATEQQRDKSKLWRKS